MNLDTGTDELLCEITSRVAVVSLNKPHKKNALGDVLTPALRALLPQLERRSDDRVFPASTFREEALQYAIEIAHGPTRPLGRLKQNLQAGLTHSLDESLALEARHMIESGHGDEARAAIAAFQEKRRPVFHPEQATTTRGLA